MSKSKESWIREFCFPVGIEREKSDQEILKPGHSDKAPGKYRRLILEYKPPR